MSESGSQWDGIMNVVVDSGKYLDKNAFRFMDEISTVDFINQSPDLGYVHCSCSHNLHIFQTLLTKFSFNMFHISLEIACDNGFPD